MADGTGIDPNTGGGVRSGVLRDVVRYSLCGLAVGASDYGTFFLLSSGLGWSALAAQSVCRPVGGLVSFLLNRFWTFRHRRGVPLRVQFGRFWIVWASAYVLALTAVGLYARLMPDHPAIAKLCADATVSVVTFTLQRQWTFARARTGT